MGVAEKKKKGGGGEGGGGGGGGGGRKATEDQRDYMFTQGHKTTEWPGQDLNSGLWTLEPVAVFRSAWATEIPQVTTSWLFCLKKQRTSHADNSFLLSTWTSCPFTGKGNDFQLHPEKTPAPCSAHRDREAHPSLRPGSPAPLLLC